MIKPTLPIRDDERIKSYQCSEHGCKVTAALTACDPLPRGWTVRATTRRFGIINTVTMIQRSRTTARYWCPDHRGGE